MQELFDSVNQALISTAGNPWVLVVTFAFVAIDGFFPPVPSESLVVALAALAISTGTPNIFVLLVISAVGAICGDNIAYLLGRRLGINERTWAARPRVARFIQTARRTLHRRPAVLLLSARYVPIGRVVVNMTAGATDFPWPRFLALSTLGGVSWAAYSVVIGVFAGGWLHHAPLLAAVLAVVVAMLLGVAVDWIARRVRRVRVARLRRLVQERADAAQTGDTSQSERSALRRNEQSALGQNGQSSPGAQNAPGAPEWPSPLKDS